MNKARPKTSREQIRLTENKDRRLAYTDRPKTTRTVRNTSNNEYEYANSIPRATSSRSRTYEYPELRLSDIPFWSPDQRKSAVKTPRSANRTAWTVNQPQDPPNTIRVATAKPRVKSAKLTLSKEMRDEDWHKYAQQMKMYLPRGFQFLLSDPEILRRLAKDPAWLAGLNGDINEVVMSYLRNVRAARVPKKKNEKNEVTTAIKSVVQNDLKQVTLPVVVNWKDAAIPAQKLDLGKSKIGEKEKTMLLLGASNTGKSTFVDSLVNYVVNVAWEDDFRLKVTDHGSEDKCWITAYNIPSTNDTKLPYTLNVIDFPAYKTGEEVDSDVDWIKKFKKFFEQYEHHGIDSVHTVCFVERSDAECVNKTQIYVYKQLQELFGTEIEKNVCNILNYDTGEDSPKIIDLFNEGQLSAERNFVFNNDVLNYGAQNDENDTNKNSESSDNERQKLENTNKQEKPHEKNTTKQNSQNDKRNDHINDTNEETHDKESKYSRKIFWNRREENFDKLFNVMERMKAQSFVVSNEELQRREQLGDGVNHLKVLIQVNCQNLQKVATEKKIIDEHNEDIKEGRDFTYETYNTEKVKRQAPNCGDNVTNCSICFTTCHQNCAIAKDEDKAGCWAMTEGYCRQCKGKCFWDKHYNRTFIFYLRISKTEQSFLNMCREYSAEPRQLPAVLRRKEKQTEKTLEEVIKKSCKVSNDLNKICSKDSARLNYNDYIDIIIHEELREGTTGWQERIQIMQEMKGKVTIGLKGLDKNKAKPMKKRAEWQ